MHILRLSRHRNLLLGVFFLATCLFFLGGTQVARAAAVPVQGYAWSSFLGWLHMSGSNYGVSKDSVTGALSGYAWSPYYGYVTFNAADVVGCPSGTCAPAVNLSTGAVTGWARSCAAFANKSACSGALDSGTGGWDGWIHLSGSNYGVTSTDGCWSGYAWGSQNIGYIKFAGTATNGGTYRVGDTTCGAQPDLTAAAPTPTSTAVSSSTVLRSVVSNIGTGSTGAGFTTLFQKATSNTGTGAVDIGTFVRSTALANGVAMTASLAYTFPVADGGTTRYIRVCADKSSAANTGAITESNETNNCSAWTAVTVSAAPAFPDLTAGAITPTSATVGTAVSLQSVVTNGGTGSTGAGFTNLFQKANDSVGTGAADIGTFVRSTALVNGVAMTASLSYTFPAGDSGTTKYVRVCADKTSAINTGSITESNETNNCGPWTAVVISAASVAPTVTTNPATSITTSGATLNGSANPNGLSATGWFRYSATSPGTCNNTFGTRVPATGGTALGSGSAGVAYSQTISGLSPNTTYYFCALASNSAGTGMGIVRLFTSTALPIPTVSLTATPSTVDSGQSSSLTWTSTNATSCTGTGFSTGGAISRSAPGVSTGALTVDPTNYSITCTGTGGSATDNVSITVEQPLASISANPDRVMSGGSSLISWSASQVTSCTTSGPGLTTSTALTGSQTVTNITSPSTYTITCQTNGSPVTDSVTVNIGPVFEEF